MSRSSNRYFPISSATILLIFLIIITEYFVLLETERQELTIKEHLKEQISSIRSTIEQKIYSTINITHGLVIYVSENPDINQETFDSIASRILRDAPIIRNIGLAKNNVITHIHPLKGNEQALGLRYLDNEKQRDAVLRAIDTGNVILAGPVKLVQGGVGLIGRIPIYTDESRNYYWGISSIVIDFDKFIQSLNIPPSLKIAIKGKDGLGADGDIILGEEEIFKNDNPVTETVLLPDGEWILTASTINGYESSIQNRTFIVRALGYPTSLTIALLLFALLRSSAAEARARQAAILANEHKSRIFTNITHELKTPLTAISGSIKLIKSGALKDTDQILSLYENIDRNTERLLILIQDVLDLKKLEEGKLDYHMEKYLLGNIITSSLDEIEQYAKYHHITIQYKDETNGNSLAFVDKSRIQQVIVNLLSNAIKYSPEDGMIEIILSKDEANLRVSVKDRGKGIAQDKIDKIFVEFGQTDTPIQSKVSSSGLGLSISKLIIDKHNGKIACYNRKQGGSACFFELPAASKS